AQWITQKTADDQEYCVYAALQQEGDRMLVAVTVAYSPADGTDVVDAARQKVDDALRTGWQRMYKPHTAWWQDFWAKSSVTLPDAQVQQHYNLVQYFYGAASRAGAPPIPLQGV